MEYADGGNLCSYVKRKKRLDEGEARRILLQLLEGVSLGLRCCLFIYNESVGPPKDIFTVRNMASIVRRLFYDNKLVLREYSL